MKRKPIEEQNKQPEMALDSGHRKSDSMIRLHNHLCLFECREPVLSFYIYKYANINA